MVEEYYETELNRYLNRLLRVHRNSTETLRSMYEESQQQCATHLEKISTLNSYIETSTTKNLEQAATIEERNTRITQLLSQVELLQAARGQDRSKELGLLQRTHETQQKSLTDLDKKVMELQHENTKLIGLVNDGKEKIQSLQARIEELECAKGNHEIISALTSSNAMALGPAGLTFENYSEIPEGHPNAGMYLEKRHRMIPYDGRIYKERTVLLELKLDVTGGNNGQTVVMNDVKFACYSSNGTEKLVSEIEPCSVVAYGQRKFAKWIIRTEENSFMV